MKISSSFTLISNILSGIFLCLALFFEHLADKAESDIASQSRFYGNYLGKVSQLIQYESAESFYDSFPSPPPQLEIPIHITNPSQKSSAPPLQKSSGWTHYQTSFSWDSIPIRSALEALSAFGSSSDGWSIAHLSFSALPDGANANASVSLKTVRRSSP